MPDIGDKAFATELIAATTKAAQAGLGDYARINRYYGTVSTVDLQKNTLSAYLSGNATASQGFSIRQGLTPATSDYVVVAIDGQNRWVESVIPPSDYQKLAISTSGYLNFGPGGAATDTNLYRSAANTLKTDDSLVVGGGSVSVASGSLWRFVRITRQVLRNGYTPTVTTDITEEATSVPANTAVALQLTIGVRESTGANVSMTAKDYDGSEAGTIATSGVAGRGGFSPVGPVLVGGTNGRQFKWAVNVTTNVTVWVYVEGYWTDK